MSQTMQRDNAFRRFATLGYERLVPIIPPGVPIYSKSALARSLGKHNDPRGKAVGVKRGDGDWMGFDWVRYEADERDYERWSNMGAGVGIKTGNGLVAIDADTLLTDCAILVRDAIERRFGHIPVRIGRAPKALYLLRVSDEYRYTRVDFGDRDERGNLPNRVEILSDGRQFVAEGVHPSTNKPYSWPRGTPRMEDVPIVAPAAIDALMAELATLLPKAQELVKEGSSAIINQTALKGDPAAITTAVKATPNTSEHFPTREHYRDFGYAIKAALPDDERLAFELWEDWCHRWTDGTNDPDVVASDWKRMKGPYRVGAGKVFETAEIASGGQFTQAHAWFEDLSTQAENPFDIAAAKAEQKEKVEVALTPSYFQFPQPADIEPRQWIYGNQYIRKFLSVTLAPSGVGKSSLAIVEALAMTSGKPLLGVKPEGKSRVWMWNGEDPRDELDRRISAAMMHHGLTKDDIEDRLLVDSGRDMPIIMASYGKDGVKVATPLVSRLERVLRDFKIDVLMIDPFVSSHLVPENDNGAINTVAKEWRQIADRCSCSIEIVHHVRKLHGAETHVDDSRGAGALNSASRVTRALTKMTKQEATLLGVGQSWRYFRFSDGKANLTPPADEMTDWMEMRSVDLGNQRMVVAADGSERFVRSDVVGVVGKADPTHLAGRVDDEDKDRVLRALGDRQWRRDVQAALWVGIPVAEALGLDIGDASDKARVKRILADMLSEGALEKLEALDDKRKMKEWVMVKTTDKLSENGLFD